MHLSEGESCGRTKKMSSRKVSVVEITGRERTEQRPIDWAIKKDGEEWHGS